MQASTDYYQKSTLAFFLYFANSVYLEKYNYLSITLSWNFLALPLNLGYYVKPNDCNNIRLSEDLT